MANLLSQNIGTNYKSILNLDATTINTPLDATLRAVTDGMGNVSPLQLSTTKVSIGTILYFNGITSAFPSIKRNGAAIDFRLADDSGPCPIVCSTITATSGGTIGGTAAGVSLGVVYNGAAVSNLSIYGFSSTTLSTGVLDVNIGRISAGLIGVGTGTTINSLGGLSLSRLIAAGLPTSRPATVGEFYQDTAANILSNGDKVVGIRQ